VIEPHAIDRTEINARITLVETARGDRHHAVLIAILMPALRRARESANAVACTSNLRQVGAGDPDVLKRQPRVPADGGRAVVADGWHARF
jgi:hypothetical protein